MDYQADEGRHCVGRGIVANTFAHGTPYPHSRYDREVQIRLFERWYGFTDRPNTRVTECLQDCFDMDWDAECGRYQVAVSERARNAAKTFTTFPFKRHADAARFVAVHYQGDNDRNNKDLSHEQAALICKEIEQLGCMPLLLDWRDESPLSHDAIRTTGRLPQSRAWGGDAEMTCAVISQCAAFVGIDSGPAKCASATDTPSLVVWTGHHPAFYHDPAPNTTHLVPYNYHNLPPVCGNRGVVKWCEDHYTTRHYDQRSGEDMVRQVGLWLKEVLR